MLFTLLGSGTSTGVPMPGCTCPVCTSTDPHNQRDRTSARITLPNDATILIDAGPDLRQQSIKHRIRSVEGVIFTHAHSDHILGTDDLRSFNFIHKQRIPCFGSAATLAGLRRSFSHIFQPDPEYQGGMLAQLDLIEISDQHPFTVLDTTFTPFPLIHGNVTVTGLRFGPIGYATDCKHLTPRALEVLHGVEYLFIDGLRYEPHPTHLSISEAVQVAQQLRVRQAYLIHLAHSIDHATVSRELPAGVALGYDGLTVQF